MNNLRILEIQEEIKNYHLKISETQQAIMERWRTIKDYTPENDYRNAERVGQVILKMKKKIKKIYKDIELAEMELNSIMKSRNEGVL